MYKRICIDALLNIIKKVSFSSYFLEISVDLELSYFDFKAVTLNHLPPSSSKYNSNDNQTQSKSETKMAILISLI